MPIQSPDVGLGTLFQETVTAPPGETVAGEAVRIFPPLVVPIVRVKVVVFVTPPPVPVIVMVYVPAGAADVVVIVSVVVHVGLQDVGEKDAEEPEGRPVVVKFTACVVPDDRVAVTEFVTELPCVTDLVPPLEREKSKVPVTVPTVSVKLVVFVTLPPVPVTVTV